MEFTFYKNNDCLVIAHNGEPLLDGIRLTVSTQRDGCCELYPDEILNFGNKIVVSFAGDVRMEYARVVFDQSGCVLQFWLEVGTLRGQQRLNYYFASNDSVKIHFKFARSIQGNYITETSTKLWFQTPQFSMDLSALPKQTQDIHILSGKDHIHIFPLVCDDMRTEFKDNALVASVGCGGICDVSGYVMSLSVSNDPYKAIKSNFEYGRKNGAIGVPLRRERTLPDMFRHFGWCTWDAFYREPTADKIYAKLAELKKLGVTPSFVLIDDGWSDTRDMRLWNFTEDSEKFPEGLGTCIRKIKGEYGVRYVGVWQTFNGYWKGIDPDSPVANEMGDVLMRCPNGLLIPSVDADKNFSFWDRWHSYLNRQGVDFVKVDNQSTYSYYIDEICKNVEGVRGAHEGLERSVFKHFDGRMINCMGMGIYDQLTRSRSALNRNSNDFLPELENWFVIHCVTNVYNAPVHSQLMWCDYDMWWSCHESAKPSSVLRAISGGPVYISDGIGATDTTYIKCLYDSDGDIPWLDSQAMPTYDCFYRDCARDEIPLKVFNRCGDNFALAAFGLSDGIVKGTFRLTDIPGTNGEYLVCEFFSGQRCVMDADSVISFSLEKYGVMLWNLYPIFNGEVLIGSDKLYMGCADKNKKRCRLCELIENAKRKGDASGI